MTKIDKAVEIVRGWSDEELKRLIKNYYVYPCAFRKIKDCNARDVICVTRKNRDDCWNEEEAE